MRRAAACSHAANQAACDDANPCTIADRRLDGLCVPGTPAGCDDGVACTRDSCEVSKGCVHTPDAGLCADNNPCTLDLCDATRGCEHPSASDVTVCDDGDPCTLNETCVAGTCGGGCLCTPADETVLLVDQPLYDNGFPFSYSTWMHADFWQTFLADQRGVLLSVTVRVKSTSATAVTVRVHAGEGIEGPALSTTTATVPAGWGVWRTLPLAIPLPIAPGRTYTLRLTFPTTTWGAVDVAIDDAYPGGGWGFRHPNPNVTNLWIWPAGQDLAFRLALAPCVERTACVTDPGLPTILGKSCDDRDPCTDDHCVTGTGVSAHTANQAPCDDGNACTDGDVCASEKCVPGLAISCDDSIACTKDSCDPGLGCRNDPDSAACDDGDSCTADVCEPIGCRHDAAVEESPCDDSSECSFRERCVGGLCGGGCTCAPGTPVVGPAQQTVPSDPALRISSSPNQPAWQSFRVSTRGGLSRLSLYGYGGLGPSTLEVREGSGANGRLLGSTSFSFAKPWLEAGSDAMFDPPLPVEPGRSFTWVLVRNPQTGPVLVGAYGNPYPDGSTEQESSAPEKGGGKPDWAFRVWIGPCAETGGCFADGTKPTILVRGCDDGNPCTTDSCDPVKGCGHVAHTLACEDGDFCHDPDVCREGKCVSGPAVDCDDKLACTQDFCDPAVGCLHLPRDSGCDDDNACTADTCDPEDRVHACGARNLGRLRRQECLHRRGPLLRRLDLYVRPGRGLRRRRRLHDRYL